MNQLATTLSHAGSGASSIPGAFKVDISRGERIGRVSSDAGRLTLAVPGRGEPVAPTRWSFGQMGEHQEVWGARDGEVQSSIN